MRRTRALLVLGLLALVAACAPPPGDEEAAERFPIKAEKVTFTVSMAFKTANDTMYAQHETTFRKFLTEYLRRGRSALVVSTSAELTPHDERALASRLRAEGIHQRFIDIRRGKLPSENTQVAVFSFRGYMVSVPECGNWNGETGFNPTNLSHTNHGCAYFRNFGLMLADPGDLVSADGTIQSDARRMDNVIRVFREGAAAGAALPKGEKGKFAAPGQEQ